MFSTLYLTGFWVFLKTAFFAVGYVIVNNTYPEPLSEEEEKKALVKFAEGDEEARGLLIEKNLRLVAHVCKKYLNTNAEQEDLLSIGTIGLIKGIDSFNIDKGAKLSTYVSRCIENEILMYFRATKKLNSEVYLNDTIGKDKDDNVVTLEEVLVNEGKSVDEIVDLKMKIKNMYEKMRDVLKTRERTILELRFGLNGKKAKTQNDIAKSMGISRSYVSRIETKAIGKLRETMKD